MGADTKGEYLKSTSRSVSRRVVSVASARDTRRGFLKSTADWLKRGAVLAVGTSTVRGAFALKADTQEGVREGKQAAASLGKDNRVSNSGVNVEPIRKESSQSSRIPFLKDIDLSGLSEDQIKLGRNTTLEANHDVFDLDIILRTSVNEDTIRSAARDNNVPEELLIGLVATESGGETEAIPDPRKRQDEQAAGLTQLMPDVARKHGLKVTNGKDDERFIPGKSLPAAASEIREEYDQRFGEWSLAFWAFHLGAPQLFDAIQACAKDAYKVSLPDIRVVSGPNKPPAQATAEAAEIKDRYRRLIQEKKLNAFKLLLNPAVRQQFQGDGWDQTLKYVSRIYASAATYSANKPIIEAYRQA